MTPAMSILFGQRVVQVSQEAHTQMVLDASTLSGLPKITARIT
jgi:hypothetical protein